MKIILLIVLIIMFFYRIKYTLRDLSKRIWQKEIKTENEKIKHEREKYSEDEWNILKLIVKTLLILLYILFILIYILVNISLNSKCIFILSVLQIFTVLHNLKKTICVKDVMNFNLEYYRFNRFRNLFNLILDYIYYPITIVMLLI